MEQLRRAGEVDCDREEVYITVVTETKVEVNTSGTAPEKLIQFRGMKKPESYNLMSVGL